MFLYLYFNAVLAFSQKGGPANCMFDPRALDMRKKRDRRVAFGSQIGGCYNLRRRLLPRERERERERVGEREIHKERRGEGEKERRTEGETEKLRRREGEKERRGEAEEGKSDEKRDRGERETYF